jgi:triosephosphate isomerase
MSIRIPLIAGNWKMYKTVSEAVQTAVRLKDLVLKAKNVDVMIAPHFAALHPVYESIKDGPIALGAQDVFWEKEGAFTGAISPAMLLSAGCRFVIIGHSERREYFGESNADVNKKVSAVLAAGLVPIMCIGESEKQRTSGETFSVLDKQLEMGLKGQFVDALQQLILAYEPIWAIGTGKTATSAQAQEVHQFLRERMARMFDDSLAKNLRILYGGSVKPQNAAELMGMPDIDGALVGGASLDAETFSRIVHFQG